MCKMDEGGRKVLIKTSSYKTCKTWDVIYILVTVVNSTVLYI